jgi:hypothetical protein
MGLAISIGYLADMVAHDPEGAEWARDDLAKLNDFLEAEGVGRFEEPDEIDGSPTRSHVGSFPYSYLHYLRRVYALVKRAPDEPVEPVGKEGVEAYDDIIADESMMMDSHLLCHADHAGFYVPIDFGEPLFADESLGIAGGGMVGSSYALRRELIEVAAPLGVELGPNGKLEDAEVERINERFDPNAMDPFERELVVWLALYENARASIEYGSAIWLH